MRMKKWDICPECGARRVAYCRFCNTLGDQFPLADLDLILPPEHAESVVFQYNSKDDRFDDGEEDTSGAVQPFLAAALGGSAFAGAGISLEGVIPRAAVMNAAAIDTLEAMKTVANREEEHQCRCHGEGHGEGGHQCRCHGEGHGEGDHQCRCHGEGHGEGDHQCRCHGEGHGEGGHQCRCHGEGHGEGDHQCRCHGEGHGEGDHQCRCHGKDTEGGGERKTVKRQVASCHRSMVDLSQPLDEDPEVGDDAEEYPLAVMCPCCDELLYPQFLKVCRQCGHEFPDGIDSETASQGTYYVPREDDWDDEDEEEGNSSKRSGKPEPAGCCLMLIGLFIGILGILA